MLTFDFMFHHHCHIEIHNLGSNTRFVLVVVSPRMCRVPQTMSRTLLVWLTHLFLMLKYLKSKNPSSFFFKFAMEMSKGASTRSDKMVPTMFAVLHPTSLLLRFSIQETSGEWLRNLLEASWLRPFLLSDSETNHSNRFKSSLFCSFFCLSTLCLVGSAPHHKPALNQEWCKNVGVIADEAGFAVDAIKAGGWDGDLSISKYRSYAVTVCVNSEHGLELAKGDGDVHLSFRQYIYIYIYLYT